jgi:hypothetical protein
MKRTVLSVLVAMLAASACTSLPEVKGPFARYSKGATQTDAAVDQPENRPYPKQYEFGGL